MTFTNIMVHMDTSRRSHLRLSLAVKLAQEYQASLTGLLAVCAPDPAWMYRVPDGGRYLKAYRQRVEEACHVVRCVFEGATEDLLVPVEWRVAEGSQLVAVQREARLSDLLIVGQDDPNDPTAFVASHFVETILLEAGRPVLAIPSAGWRREIGRRIMVAWNGSRESARAIHDALPFLRRADSVEVVSCTVAGKRRDDWLAPSQAVPGRRPVGRFASTRRVRALADA
jgi:nucleotide-binding universal stress UspA family protein